MDYVFVSRGKSGDGFSNEPAASHFLGVPSSANDMKYAHRISKSKWTKAILKEAMGGTSNPLTEGDIVFYVHGFNNSQATVLKRHRKIKKGLEKQGFDGVVVSFDWPGAESALNYLEDREDAKLSAFRLVRDGIETFSALQQPDCRIDLHVLAHSMGCYVVREAFDDADDRARIAGRSWAVSQVMLMAADLSVDSLSKGNPKSSSLYRHCARLTNYYNPLDDVLSISAVKRLGVAPRAGRTGMEAPEHPKGVDIYCGKRFRDGKHGSSIRAGHTWYFDDPVVMEDIYHTICGRLDRHEIPTRAFTDKGNLGLK
ncbi:MAG: alpha/beta hydrolase [Planktotalea sp.]|uniref:alpha/beta hydrolase n=1 Tax=Planktotalea sp. TaxID=2029877 RepID=UPI00262C0246|nr:alpha/beta hydrolase [Planktotalea sp.]MDG1077733.1 alpha/beta hydrolase [Planktotalea sp.]